MKFQPCDWSLTDEESKEQGRITPTQEWSIQRILDTIGDSDGAICGDEPGFGKTLIGTEVILRAIELHGWTRILLVALPNTHKQWAERIELQADGETPVPAYILNGTKAGKENYARFMKHEPGIFIAGAAYLQEKDWESVPQVDDDGEPVWDIDKKTRLPKLKDGEPVVKMKSVRKNTFDRFGRKPLDAVVADECQVWANRKAKGRQTILSIKAGFHAMFSGTWFNNKVENQWSIARLTWPGLDPEGKPWIETNFSRWSDEWLIREDVVSRGGRVLESPHGGSIKKVVGEKVPGAFAASLPCYIRRENADRPPAPLEIRVEPLPVQLAQMDELQENLIAWVRDWEGQEAPLVVDLPITLRMRLRQVAIAELSVEYTPEGGETVAFKPDAQSAKLAPLRYLLEERWAGQPVGIFTDSKIGAHFVTARLQKAGKRARAWTGDLSAKEREALKTSFLEGEFDYLVGTVQSMGTGIDGLQKRASKVAWISEADGNPALNEQALARYFRQGRTMEYGEFEHARLICAGTVDEIALQNLLDSAWSMRTALNAGRAAV